MANMDDVRRLVAADQGLAVVSTIGADGGPQSSVVNAGVLAHPVTGADTVAFVIRSGTIKQRNIRADPRVTVVFRAGWDWVGVQGTGELIGPDDVYGDFDTAGLAQLLRQVFTAAGGTHDDWDTYDEVMRQERRTAVLVTPRRTYGNPPG